MKESLMTMTNVIATKAGNGSLKTEQNEIENLLTTEELATLLKVSPGVVRNMTSNGQLPYYKLGRRNRYWWSEIKKLLSSTHKGAIYGY